MIERSVRFECRRNAETGSTQELATGRASTKPLCLRFSRRFLIALVPSLVLSLHSSAEEVTRKYDDFTAKVSTVISSKQGSTYKTLANVGTLECGKNGIVEIEVENPFEFDIPIASILSSCGCARARILQDIIPAKGSAKVEVRVATPERNEDARFHSLISMSVAKGKIRGLNRVSIALTYDIHGMLCFVDRFISATVKEDTSREFMVPFVATLETPLKDLVIETEGALEGVRGRVVQLGQEGKNAVAIEIEPDMGKREGNHGRITIRDPKSNVSTSVDLVLYKEKRLTISPRTLRFHEDDGRLEANAILHRRSAVKEQTIDGDSHTAEPLYCSASIGKRHLRVDVTRLSHNVFRLKVHLPQSNELQEEIQSESKIAWIVMVGEEKHSLQSPFSLPE